MTEQQALLFCLLCVATPPVLAFFFVALIGLVGDILRLGGR